MTSFIAQPTSGSTFPIRQTGIVLGVMVLHMCAGWSLLQLKPPVIEPIKPKPIQIKMVELTPPPAVAATPKKPEPPKPIVPPKQVQIVEQPNPQPITPKPLPKPVIAAKPTPAPTPQPETVPVLAAPAPLDVDPPPAVTTVAPTPAPTPVEKVSSTPKTVSITGVSYLHAPEAEYPESARDRGESGIVIVKTLIGTHGKVESAVVDRTSGSRQLDQAAIRAVKRARFHPYQENGVAVAVYTLIPIEFTLED
jgi:periplasmic protein TonB